MRERRSRQHTSGVPISKKKKNVEIGAVWYIDIREKLERVEH